jgi:hypothetical protein
VIWNTYFAPHTGLDSRSENHTDSLEALAGKRRKAMATAYTPTHTAMDGLETRRQNKPAERNQIIAFVADLIEDVRQKPLQDAALAKHDMFHEHIIAMSVSYFALIVLLIGASVPLIAYLLS